MSRALSLKVEGLREATTAMRKMKGETPKAVSQYHRQVAEFVARDVRARAESRPRSAHTGRTSKSVKASGTMREAKIVVGSVDAYIQEFGGRAPLFGNRSKWHQVRPVNKEGYFLYPAVRANRDRISRFYLKGLEEAIARYWIG
jgi:hypothetical protein